MIDTSAEALRRHSDWLAVMCGPEHPICYTLDAIAAEKEAAALAAERTAAAPDVVERGWPVSASQMARRILVELGIGDDPSLELGADPRRDRIAAMLAPVFDRAAALAALRPGDDVPAGVVVPREPTEAMLKAGGRRADDFMSERGPYPRTKAVYRAMLSAIKGGEDA